MLALLSPGDGDRNSRVGSGRRPPPSGTSQGGGGGRVRGRSELEGDEEQQPEGVDELARRSAAFFRGPPRGTDRTRWFWPALRRRESELVEW